MARHVATDSAGPCRATAGRTEDAIAASPGTCFRYDGLWGLAFGNNGAGFDPNNLYFAAGINDERDGLFGSLAAAAPGPTAPIPEPGTLALVGIAALWVMARWRRHSSLS